MSHQQQNNTAAPPPSATSSFSFQKITSSRVGAVATTNSSSNKQNIHSAGGVSDAQVNKVFNSLLEREHKLRRDGTVSADGYFDPEQQQQQQSNQLAGVVLSDVTNLNSCGGNDASINAVAAAPLVKGVSFAAVPTTAKLPTSAATAASALEGTIVFPRRGRNQPLRQRFNSAVICDGREVESAVGVAESLFHLPFQQIRVDVPFWRSANGDQQVQQKQNPFFNLNNNDTTSPLGASHTFLRGMCRSIEEAAVSYHWEGSSSASQQSTSNNSSSTLANLSRFLRCFGDVHQKFLRKVRVEHNKQQSSNSNESNESNNTTGSGFDGFYLECCEHPIWRSFVIMFFLERGKPLVAITSNSATFRDTITRYCACVGVGVDWINGAALLGISAVRPPPGMMHQENHNGTNGNNSGFVAATVVFNFLAHIHEVQPYRADGSAAIFGDDVAAQDNEAESQTASNSQRNAVHEFGDDQQNQHDNAATNITREKLFGLPNSQKYVGLIERGILFPAETEQDEAVLRRNALFPYVSIVSGFVFHGSVMRQASVRYQIVVPSPQQQPTQPRSAHLAQTVVITIGNGYGGTDSAVLLPHFLPFLTKFLLGRNAAVNHLLFSFLPYLGRNALLAGRRSGGGGNEVQQQSNLRKSATAGAIEASKRNAAAAAHSAAGGGAMRPISGVGGAGGGTGTGGGGGAGIGARDALLGYALVTNATASLSSNSNIGGFFVVSNNKNATGILEVCQLGGNAIGGAQVFHSGGNNGNNTVAQAAITTTAPDVLASDLRSKKIRTCWLALSRLSCESWLSDAVAPCGDRKTALVFADDDDADEIAGALLSADDRLDSEFLLRSLELRRAVTTTPATQGQQKQETTTRRRQRCDGDDNDEGDEVSQQQNHEHEQDEEEQGFFVAIGIDVIRTFVPHED